MKKIRVFVSGACGKMGQEVVRTLLEQDDMTLVGAADARHLGMDIGYVIGGPRVGVDVSGPLEREPLRVSGADVLVDFTNPHSVLSNIKLAIKEGVVPVVGTTGLNGAEIDEVQALVEQERIGAVIVPNFSIGALLMMRFAQQAAKFFPHVEIIELHHNQKLDAPSGTALKTTEWISEARDPLNQGHPNEYEKIAGVRGGDVQGMHIHSVRLPGLIAHQEVIFGGLGQALTIRHDAFTRDTYMPGVTMAIRKAVGLTKLVIGLENFLD